MEPLHFLLLAPSILLGLTLHEFAHGFVATVLGDPTPRQQGRLTLNPLAHLDLFGTIMLFVVHFGWAKPVLVNPGYFRNPKRDMLLVALAGPFTNLVLAAIFGVLIRFINPQLIHSQSMLFMFLYLGMLINISLAVFNMLPIPPLDGSRLIHAVWPDQYEKQYLVFQKVSVVVLIGALIISYVTGNSLIGAILHPFLRFFMRLFTGV